MHTACTLCNGSRIAPDGTVVLCREHAAMVAERIRHYDNAVYAAQRKLFLACIHKEGKTPGKTP